MASQNTSRVVLYMTLVWAAALYFVPVLIGLVIFTIETVFDTSLSQMGGEIYN